MFRRLRKKILSTGGQSFSTMDYKGKTMGIDIPSRELYRDTTFAGQLIIWIYLELWMPFFCPPVVSDLQTGADDV